LRQPNDHAGETGAQRRKLLESVEVPAMLDRIISTVAATSTFAAVVVALYLARRSEAVRLSALLSIGVSGTDPSQLVILQIYNTRVRGVSLAPPPCFEWRVPFRGQRQPETMISSINSVYSINRENLGDDITVTAPMKIEVTDIDTFRTQFTRVLPCIEAKLRCFPKTRLKRLRAMIYTNDDHRFRVAFSNAMAGEIRSLINDYLSNKTKDTRRCRP
jgi:hypothetical protein